MGSLRGPSAITLTPATVHRRVALRSVVSDWHYHSIMAKKGDGTASLNEVFTDLGDGFAALWDAFAATLDSLWNYPIQWDDLVKSVGYLLFVGLAVFAFGFYFIFLKNLGIIFWDLIVIAWLLTKRRLRS